ncbi:hypothetical protein BSL78_23132 [Apostichopus japonicus]|uniref:Uncharacterized protein n=1 Tax=Stichopus japonicus TaxID=307972 RepID=A0A2G8JWA3_STIJA|nr:hypothetical protein BSL78_23132 [Apostichopus japonicus]
MAKFISGLVIMTVIALTYGQCPSSCSCLFFSVNQIHVICIDAQLSSFPGNIPSQTTYLSLATNSISSINATDLAGLGNLQILDLSDNQIEAIDDDAFLSLTELEELFLEENKLKSFGPQHVHNMAKLAILDLSSNPYLTLDECFLSPLDKLETLRLSGSPINFGLDLFGNATLCTSYRCNALSDRRCHLPLLKELDISETLTNEVPVELFLLTPNLEKLFLARNVITSIPDDAFVGLNSLQDLSLNYNNMTNVNQRTLNGLGGLTKLELGNLGLVIEVDIFAVLPNLSELSLTLLGQVVIDSLAPSVANTDVTKLNLHDNFLVSIPASMSHISTITSLDLSQNAITHVPERAFSSSLKEIDLSNNNLDSLHQDAFDGLSQLETLKLCYNELAIVPSSVFNPIPLATTICLGQNPWVCICTMLAIIVDSRHYTFPYPQCSSPTDLSEHPFTAVDKDDLNCPFSTTATSQKPLVTTKLPPATGSKHTTKASPATQLTTQYVPPTRPTITPTTTRKSKHTTKASPATRLTTKYVPPTRPTVTLTPTRKSTPRTSQTSPSPLHSTSPSSQRHEFTSTPSASRQITRYTLSASPAGVTTDNQTTIFIIITAMCFLFVVVTLLTIAMFWNIYGTRRRTYNDEGRRVGDHFNGGVPTTPPQRYESVPEEISHIYLSHAAQYAQIHHNYFGENDNASGIYDDHGITLPAYSRNNPLYERGFPTVNTLSDGVAGRELVSMANLPHDNNSAYSTAPAEPVYMEIIEG